MWKYDIEMAEVLTSFVSLFTDKFFGAHPHGFGRRWTAEQDY